MNILTVHQVPKEKWRDTLFYCFSTDKELIDKWHIESGSRLNNCVNRTLKDLLICDNLVMYIIMVDEVIAAYFCKEELYGLNAMTGFMIIPKFRNKDFITKFWIKVMGVFNIKEFYVGVYTKNEAAIKFLNKKGSVFIQDDIKTIIKIEGNK